MKTGQRSNRGGVMKDNRGFSLIELILIIAMMALVLGFGAVQVDSLFGYSAKEARSKLYTSLENLQTACLSKTRIPASKSSDAEIYLEIYEEDSIHYMKYVEFGTETKIKLGPKRISIMYNVGDDPDDETAYTAIDSSGGAAGTLYLSYSRTTGSFLPINDSGDCVRWIRIAGGRKSYQLQLMPNTGKVMMMH